MQLPPMLQGGKARELAAFLQSVTQGGAVVLPDATQKAAAFHAVVHSLVYDVLMSKVSSRRICPIYMPLAAVISTGGPSRCEQAGRRSGACAELALLGSLHVPPPCILLHVQHSGVLTPSMSRHCQ